MPEDFEKRIRERIQESEEIKEKLVSLILFGSIVRGDYTPGLSDLDFFAGARGRI